MSVSSNLLGDFQLQAELGQGTLGTTFLGEHRFTKQPVVIKLFAPELSQDTEFLKRFQESAKLLSRLIHPNIVRLHTVSCDRDTFFLVSDFVKGPFGESLNLAQYVYKLGRRLSEDEIGGLLLQVAEGLDYAHEHSSAIFCHLGLKLNNILVSEEEGRLKFSLSDFGLSYMVGVGAILKKQIQMVADSLNITLNNFKNLPRERLSYLQASFMQSYAFLPPELKRPSMQPSIKSDVYSFGILAYYLLVGDFPEGYFDMPSQRVPGSRAGWDHLIKHCLFMNPERRKRGLKELVLQAMTSSDQLAVQLDTRPLKPLIRSMQLERPDAESASASFVKADSSVKQYTPEVKEALNVQPLLTEMKIIPGGLFYRGSQDGARDEMPKHQVEIASFAIDVHPVTNEQFVRFLEVMGGEKDKSNHDIIRLRDSRIKRVAGKLVIESGYAKHPVVGVTWYGAVAYAKWVGKRLPTEAEWEIAARGGLEHAVYPTGDDIEKSEANFFSSDTTAVMSYAPNEYGLYDIAGNVYEWCQDWYGYNYYEESAQEPENPKGPLQGVYRVLRGGCWKSLKEDLACSKRHRNNPGTVNSTYGFRCSADVIA